MKSPSRTKLCRKRQSFRDLSTQFLKSEMPQHAVTELLLFGILFAVSAWPILSLAAALAALLK